MDFRHKDRSRGEEVDFSRYYLSSYEMMKYRVGSRVFWCCWDDSKVG